MCRSPSKQGHAPALLSGTAMVSTCTRLLLTADCAGRGTPKQGLRALGPATGCSPTAAQGPPALLLITGLLALMYHLHQAPSVHCWLRRQGRQQGARAVGQATRCAPTATPGTARSTAAQAGAVREAGCGDQQGGQAKYSFHALAQTERCCVSRLCRSCSSFTYAQQNLDLSWTNQLKKC